LDRARKDFEAAGLDLVLIGQLTPRHAAHFRRRQKIETTVLADEGRRSYKAAGAKVGNLNDLLGPKVVAKGALTSLRTKQVQGKTLGHPAQLGGAMVIAPPGEIVFSRMAKDASDNVTPNELLRPVSPTA
jgi:peroxiredoxin